MKKCSECEYCLEKWCGPTFCGYICKKTYENILNENTPPCQKKENK